MPRLIAAILFVGCLGLVAEAMPIDPAKPGCDCCKCKSCACAERIPLPMPRAVQQTPSPKAGPIVSFEEALRDQIEGRPETIRSRRVLAVLDMEDGPRRDRILARMERHTRVHFDVKGDDWSGANFDWNKFFDFVMKLLAAILPLLLL